MQLILGLGRSPIAMKVLIPHKDWKRSQWRRQGKACRSLAILHGVVAVNRQTRKNARMGLLNFMHKTHKQAARRLLRDVIS